MRYVPKRVAWLMLWATLFMGIAGADADCDIRIEDDDGIGDIWDDIEDEF